MLIRMSPDNIGRYVELGRQGARRIAAELGHQPSAMHNAEEWRRALVFS